MTEVVHTNLAHKLHRGDDSMVVAEYEVGKSKVKINTAFVDLEEREQVDHEVAMAAWSIIDELVAVGEEV